MDGRIIDAGPCASRFRHVLVAFEYGSINGGENSFLAVVDELRTVGWCFSALVPDDTELATLLRTRSIPVHPLQLHNHATGTRLSQDEIRAQIAATVQTQTPDLVHANSLSMSRLCGPVCAELGVPSLGYLRDILKISRKAMDDINQLDCIVAVSDATRDFHLQRGLSAERSITSHNGIAPKTFLPPDNQSDASKPTSTIAAELGIPTDAALLLFVGQIGMRKGIDTLIDAFLEIASHKRGEASEVHLLIAGQRHSQKQEAIEFENALQRTGQNSDFHDSIHWLGRRSDIARLMHQSTVLLHPARQEPLGRVLLEAATAGLPIVATHVGGTAEIIQGPELEQFLVAPDDHHALAAATCRLLENEPLRRATAESLQQLMATHFTTTACASRLDACYRRICRKRATE